MIKRLNYKNVLDVKEFVTRVKDTYEEMYITLNKQRTFLIDLKLIEKILKYQDVYVIEEKEIKALLLIYKEKGFRPYIKMLVDKTEYIYDFIKFINWNFSEELFIKVKKENPIAKIAQKKGFIFAGNRGSEILLKKEKREINKNDHYYSKD